MTGEKLELNTDISKAIDELDKKSKIELKGSEEKIKIEPIEKYKERAFSKTINNILSKMDKDCGNVYFGENLERSAEYYGVKANPLVALAVSSIAILVIMVKKVLFRQKDQEANNGIFGNNN